jgi:tetratricopeptide (TPR) repeat protein
VSVLTGAPEDRAMADRLTGELKSTLSHMRGLRLIEAPSASAPPKTDLVLDGSVERDGGQPSVKLALHDGRSGARVWGATFDGRAMADPTVEERAVAAPTQYLAIWLGERLSGRPAARDPESPELATLVIQGRRALREADDARLRRQWPRFLQLTRAAEDATDRALAMDPHAPRALMLRFELDSWPLYPRPGESPQAFKTRREAGARALDQALAADPDDPEVLIAAGQEDTRGLRWDDAGKLLQRAVAIDPNSADANVWYAYHLGRIGQCAAGLRYARIAAGLQPDQVWTQMAPPRLLLCAGRQDEALADYRALQVKEPGNVFLVRDIYLWLMARRHSDGIRKMVAFERDGLWGGRPPGPIAAVLSRAGAGADALDGKPQALIAQLDAEYAAITHHEAGPLAFGRSEGDALFPLALEYAEAGDTDKALNTLREAVEAGSLYLPWALPYGSNPFPASVRDDARFKALWKSSKALSELMDQRRRALATR